jgi:hypothetical protein
MITIAGVVEGDGEVRALPVLVRRIAHEHGIYDIEVPLPFRLPRTKFLIPAEFARAVEFQARRIAGRGGIVALLDADDDCAVELTKRIRTAYDGHRSFAIVASVREYESVLLMGQGVTADFAESKRDAKGELRRRLGAYRETIHQEKLSATLDLTLARECRWFRKFEQDLLAILGD